MYNFPSLSLFLTLLLSLWLLNIPFNQVPSGGHLGDSSLLLLPTMLPAIRDRVRTSLTCMYKHVCSCERPGSWVRGTCTCSPEMLQLLSRGWLVPQPAHASLLPQATGQGGSSQRRSRKTYFTAAFTCIILLGVRTACLFICSSLSVLYMVHTFLLHFSIHFLTNLQKLFIWQGNEPFAHDRSCNTPSIYFSLPLLMVPVAGRCFSYLYKHICLLLSGLWGLGDSKPGLLTPSQGCVGTLQGSRLRSRPQKGTLALTCSDIPPSRNLCG